MIVRPFEKCQIMHVLRHPSVDSNGKVLDPKDPNARKDSADFDYLEVGEDGRPVIDKKTGQPIDGKLSRDEHGRVIGPIVPVNELRADGSYDFGVPPPPPSVEAAAPSAASNQITEALMKLLSDQGETIKQLRQDIAELRAKPAKGKREAEPAAT